MRVSGAAGGVAPAAPVAAAAPLCVRVSEGSELRASPHGTTVSGRRPPMSTLTESQLVLCAGVPRHTGRAAIHGWNWRAASENWGLARGRTGSQSHQAQGVETGGEGRRGAACHGCRVGSDRLHVN